VNLTVPLAVLIPLAALGVPIFIWSISRVLTMEGRVSSIETKVNVFWKVVESNALEILHHPDRPELDAAIDQRKESLTKGVSKLEQTQVYIEKLQAAIEDTRLSPGDRMAATMLLATAIARQAEPIKRRPFWKFW